MRSSNEGSRIEAAIAQLHEALDVLTSADLLSLHDLDLLEATRAFEHVGRRCDAAQARFAADLESSRAHRIDGHQTASVFLRHACSLSTGEARARVRVGRALRDLPLVAAAYEAGDLSTDHVRLFAGVWSNPRVRDQLPDSEVMLLEDALTFSYRYFKILLGHWERLADADGADQKAEVNHRRRTFSLTQNHDLSWTLTGSFGSMMGAVLAAILDAFTDLEYQVDVDKARAEHGDDYAVDQLARTPVQRRADAFFHLAQSAASANPEIDIADASASIHMDADTAVETLDRLLGDDKIKPDPSTYRKRRSMTESGHPVDPGEALRVAVHGRLRRVLLGADHSVIDLGRSSRFFHGNARLAALLNHETCTHIGCEVIAAMCDADHTIEWSKGGRTDINNAGPRCRFHNNLKNHGYTTTRDIDGTWISRRPDGSLIE